jgi:hypothetical protein
MPLEFHGKFVLTETGIVFVFSGPMSEYDSEYLFRQFLKCDAHFDLHQIEGVKPSLVFPFVRRLDDDRT